MAALPVLLTASAPTLSNAAFIHAFRELLQDGARPLTYFGEHLPSGVQLTVVLQDAGGLRVLRGEAATDAQLPALTVQFPQLQIFEREIHEQTGLAMPGHPWLKPVRSPVAPMGTYPFFRVEGKEVHEVAVGPIHAGVIEPGHFRFMCLGELVHHLEIQLGYQHRGIEGLLLRRPLAHAPALVETIAGDTSIGHLWAFCRAVEALAGVEVPVEAEIVRGIALELERVAMHLTGLSGMATDIGFLQGGTTWGRLRTTIINLSMQFCGSRFGRGWLRPGGVRFGIDAASAQKAPAILYNFQRDMNTVAALFTTSLSVNGRLHEVGTVTAEQAREMGLVGMTARASGLDLDLRTSLPGAAYERLPLPLTTQLTGDCWARALLRIAEIKHSIHWLQEALAVPGLVATPISAIGPLQPNALAVGVCEGWRGEVVHALQTDERGQLRHFKAQDPSLRNWFGLALALRGNEISDFPICNKSFDLSYCGNDL
jgi:Ni,Fe-hydrogenase III large subunit